MATYKLRKYAEGRYEVRTPCGRGRIGEVFGANGTYRAFIVGIDMGRTFKTRKAAAEAVAATVAPGN